MYIIWFSYIDTMNVNHLVPRKLQAAERVPQLQTPNKGAAPKATAESGSEAREICLNPSAGGTLW